MFSSFIILKNFAYIHIYMTCQFLLFSLQSFLFSDKLFQYLRSSNAKEPAVAVAGLDHLQLNEEWTPVGEPYIVRLPAHAAPPLPAVPAVPASRTVGDSDEAPIMSPSGFSREANHKRY